MQLFLIHGMGRTRLSLFPLATRLRRAGHATSIVGYSVAAHSFEENAEKILGLVQQAANGTPYGIVAHSLGGILTRSIAPRLPSGFERFVMLGPPNRPVVMAKHLAKNRLYQMLTGASGQRLGDDAFYAKLPVPSVPTLVIAGTLGRSDPWSPFDGPNDGIVSVEETRLPGAQHLEVRAVHTWIMNDRCAQEAVVEFLR